jgi:hypothetical protein
MGAILIQHGVELLFQWISGFQAASGRMPTLEELKAQRDALADKIIGQADAELAAKGAK